jgi:hypothetical protein
MLGLGALTGLPIDACVKKWLSELRLFDALDFPRSCRGAFVAVALLTLRRHGSAVCPVWDRFRQQQGIKVDDRADGVEHLERLRRKRGGGGGTEIIRKEAAYAIACVETALRGDLVKYVKNIDPIEYCRKMPLEQETFADLVVTLRAAAEVDRADRASARILQRVIDEEQRSRSH